MSDPITSAVDDVVSTNTPSSIDSIVGEMAKEQAQRAKIQALPAVGSNPEQAAEAVRLGKDLGHPASVIELDPERYKRQVQTSEAARIIDQNPAAQRFIINNPTAAKVSTDDWGSLNTVTQHMAEFERSIAGWWESSKVRREAQGKEWGGLRGVLQAPTDVAASALGGFVEGFGKYFGDGGPGSWIKQDDLGTGALASAGRMAWTMLGFPLEAGIRIGGGAIGGVAEGFGKGAGELYSRVTGDEAGAERFARDMSGMVEAHITGLSGQHSPTVSGQAVVNAATRMLERQIDAAIKRLDSVKAVGDLDKLVEASTESKTKSRSPDTFGDFMGQHEGAQEPLFMSVDKVLELYKESGKELTDPKGPLGFIPDLSEQVARAITDGTEVNVATQVYVTNVTPEMHQKLREEIRAGEDRKTVKEIIEENKKEVPKEEQPAAEIDAAIEENETDLGLRPIFSEPLPGMTKTLFDRYDRLVKEQQEEVTARLTERATEIEKRKQTAEWKAELAEKTQEAMTDLHSQAEIAAERFFRDGVLPTGEVFKERIKLDAEAVKRIDPNSDLSRYTAKDGVHPDTVASYFGFDSGVELVRALESLRQARGDEGLSPRAYVERLAKEIAERRMEEQHGLLQENIYEAAKEVVAGVKRAEILHLELEMLAKSLGKEVPFTKDELVAITKDEFSKLKLPDAVKSKAFDRALQKAGKEVEDALVKAKPDYTAAFQAKQQQMRAFLKRQMAMELGRDYNRFLRQVDGLLSKATVESMDPLMVSHLQDLLKNAGFAVRRAADSLKAGLEGKALTDVMAEYQEKGYVLEGDPYAGGRVTIDAMTAQEYTDFATFVRSAMKAGRDSQTVVINGKKQALKTAVDEIATNLSKLKGSFDASDTSFPRALAAGIVRMERLLDWMDLNDPTGPMNTLVFRKLSEAKHWGTDKLRAVAADLSKVPSSWEWRKSLHDEVANTTLLDPKTGQPMKINREMLIAMALNTGTDSNFKVLRDGYEWKGHELLSFIDTNMRAADWDFVRGIWDVFDKNLKDDVQRVTTNLSGVAITLPKGVDRVLPDGTKLEGKYYPLQADPRYLTEHTKVGNDRFDNPNFNALPTAAALKQRTGSTYPLRLDLSGIAGRLQETVHALAYREAIKDAAKILDQPRVRQGLSEAFGQEFTRRIDPWLDYIASNGGYANETLWGTLGRELRSNAQSFLIGFNLITPLLHGTGALANSIETVGFIPFFRTAGHVMQSAIATRIDRFMRNPQVAKSMTQEALEQSGELRNRMHNLDDNFTYVMEKLNTAHGLGELLWETKGNILPSMTKGWDAFKADLGNLGDAVLQSRRWYLQNSMYLVAALDQASAIPTWIAARDMAVKEGKSMSDAVYIADKAVRNAHGSSGIVDVSAVQREAFLKNLLLFYNYFNHNANQLMDTYVTTNNDLAKDRGRSTTRFLAERGFYYLVVGAVMHEVLRGHHEDDDNMFKIAASALTGQFLGGYPFLRDVWYSLASGQKPQLTALGETLNVQQFAKDLRRTIGMERGMPSKKMLQHGLELPAVIGFGSKQIAKTSQFLYDLANDRQTFDNPFEFGRGVLYGESKPKRH